VTGSKRERPPPPIRTAVPADLADLKAVIDALGLFPSNMLEEMIAPFFADPHGPEFWLTVDQGRCVAVVYCAPERMTSGTCNLLLIAIEPAEKGWGLGKALMREVERRLQARGDRLLLVETSGLPEFEATRGFYCSIGYREEARIRDFYNAGEDKIVFTRALADSAAE